MSFFFDLTKLGELFQDQCTNYTDDWVSGFFAAYDYWPLFVGLMILGLTLEHREVFYVLVFFGVLFNALINWGFRAIINQEGPEPVCFNDIQMPAYATDGLTFLTVVTMIASGYTYGVPVRWFKLALFWMGGPIGIYARIWLRANTPAQMMAGTAFGLVEALIYSTVLLYVFTYERIDKWFLRHNNMIVGSDCQDTMIRPHTPVVVTNAPIQQICAKITSSDGYNNSRLLEVVEVRRAEQNEAQQMRSERLEYERNNGLFVALNLPEDEQAEFGDRVTIAEANVKVRYWNVNV